LKINFSFPHRLIGTLIVGVITLRNNHNNNDGAKMSLKSCMGKFFFEIFLNEKFMKFLTKKLDIQNFQEKLHFKILGLNFF
jgi:hypothetical protein